ncbi:MAG: MATE family efflux transporter, partial [Candidatus Aquilonibacter sp.]
MTDAQSMIVDHTKIGAALRRLSLPLAVQMLGDQLLGTVDTIAIGYISVGALAGVTAATTVFFTLIMLLGGLWSGLGIIAAQRIGAH